MKSLTPYVGIPASSAVVLSPVTSSGSLIEKVRNTGAD